MLKFLKTLLKIITLSFIFKFIYDFYKLIKTALNGGNLNNGSKGKPMGTFGSILNFVSSLINLKASQNNKEYADVIKETDVNLRIQQNNKDIAEGNIDNIAAKLHEFSTLVGKEE